MSASDKVAETEKKQTNFDRLKQSDIKEVAKIMASFAHEANGVFHTPLTILEALACKWLESEVKT